MSKANSTIGNLLWKFAERISAQLVTLLVSVVLARLLQPSDYGIISVVTIFITLANVLVSDGFGNALIQKKDADVLDFCSVLYANVGLMVLLYGLLFALAPALGSFFGEGYEKLPAVVRVLGLRVIVAGVNSVQHAYVSRKMIFRKFFWSTLIGTIASAVVGIGLAYAGAGVWALVAQYLTNTTVDTLVLAITLKKKPRLLFSLERLKGLMRYGSKVLGTSLLITGYQQLRSLIIGKVYSSADLAYFDKGQQFPSLIVTNINTSITAVLFPKMSKEQDDLARVKQTARTAICFSSYIMSPLMLGLAAVAEPFVRLVLTEKWLPCVLLMRLFCVTYLFQPMHSANAQAIKAIGRSDIYLKLELVKKALELAVLVSVMWISVEAIAVGMAVMTVPFTAINALPNQKLLGYTLKEQISDILPAIVMAGIMAVAVYLIGMLPLDTLPLLVIQVLSGACIYLLLSVATKNPQLKYLCSVLGSLFHKKRNGDSK